MEKKQLYRSLPKVDLFLSTEEGQILIKQYGKEAVAGALRMELERLRGLIAEEEPEENIKKSLAGLQNNLKRQLEKQQKPRMRRVINATGVLLHTNLGRAPMDKQAAERLCEILQGYSNLEYDLESGKRGERYSHFEELLCSLTGAEAAMAVNNNAAAVMLMLNTFAKGKEVILSRGEMIEIGGKFRIPEVMETSGCRLREIGTTNKTHLADYENAVGPETGAILKVHTSNYRVMGFTSSVRLKELEPLKKKYGLPLVEDLGSGVLINLEEFGLEHEPTVQESLSAGADVVCFSGDKLLGGPQAGILAGRKEMIEQIKKNPLTRALRIDKCTACLLEEILRSYHAGIYKQRIPIYRYLSRSSEELEKMAEKMGGILQRELERREGGKRIQPEEVSWQVRRQTAPMGGGSLPMEEIETRVLSVAFAHLSTDKAAKALHRAEIPAVVRIAEDELIFDMRCMEEEDLETAAEELAEYVEQALEN